MWQQLPNLSLPYGELPPTDSRWLFCIAWGPPAAPWLAWQWCFFNVQYKVYLYDIFNRLGR
jgi:hypothetical protein